ncbi:unnamed protein product [Urochloa humidicola]
MVGEGGGGQEAFEARVKRLFRSCLGGRSRRRRPRGHALRLRLRRCQRVPPRVEAQVQAGGVRRGSSRVGPAAAVMEQVQHGFSFPYATPPWRRRGAQGRHRRRRDPIGAPQPSRPSPDEVHRFKENFPEEHHPLQINSGTGASSNNGNMENSVIASVNSNRILLMRVLTRGLQH